MSTLGFEPTRDVHGVKLPAQPLSFYMTCQIDTWYVSQLYAYPSAGGLKNEKKHPSPGDDASTAEAAPGRVRRDEQGEARRANTTPNGVSHLELGHLRLKTCKSDFSTAETTPIHASISHNGIGPFFYQDIS